MKLSSLYSRFVTTATLWGLAIWFSASASAQFHFSTGEVDGQIGTGARPSSPSLIQIETGDDFVLSQSIAINHATFTGLLPATSRLGSIKEVTVEFYHVFPV